MMQKICNFFKEKKEKGQSIIEYAILIGIIVTAVITVRSSTKMDEQLAELANGINSNISLTTSAAVQTGKSS